MSGSEKVFKDDNILSFISSQALFVKVSAKMLLKLSFSDEPNSFSKYFTAIVKVFPEPADALYISYLVFKKFSFIHKNT